MLAIDGGVCLGLSCRFVFFYGRSVMEHASHGGREPMHGAAGGSEGRTVLRYLSTAADGIDCVTYISGHVLFLAGLAFVSSIFVDY